MSNGRENRAKLNIIFSLFGQMVTLVCGLIVPKVLISNFGSEAYGATASIGQFLAYISLLEGGIGGVARAALYKPLALNDKKAIGGILNEIQRFFRVIAMVFAIYVMILACSFKYISHVQCFDWLSTFLLVIVISISTFSQYYVGITYQVLLQAAQRTYITQIFSSSVTILNTVCVVILVACHSNLIIVKLVSSIVFFIKPLGQYLYVKNKLHITKTNERNKSSLQQKWTGLGQHLAFFFHSNTDIAVLTILSNLSYVAVYSVYNMIVSQVKNISTSFSTGMEALFGDMIAKNEMTTLHRTFNMYEALISFVSGLLFSVTSVMIIPFVKLYTRGIEDVNYIYPVFALLLVLASYLSCIRTPYHSVTIASGHFKETKMAAYGEAIINILLSIVMVIKLNLLGVVIGTVAAVLFRTIYYVLYLSKNIIYRDVKLFLKRIMCNIGAISLIIFAGNFVVNICNVDNWFEWVLCSSIVCILALVVQTITLFIFFNDIANDVLSKIGLKFRKNKTNS